MLTLLVALGWIGGTYRIARWMGTLNMARVVGAAMTGTLIDPEAGVARGLVGPMLGFVPPVPSERDAERAEIARQVQRHVAYAEAVIYVWERAMYSVGGVLAVVGLWATVRATARYAYLFGGVIVLLSTAATLVAIHLLMDPEKGGLDPLPARRQAIVAVIQGAYALVLLAAFHATRNRREAT